VKGRETGNFQKRQPKLASGEGRGLKGGKKRSKKNTGVLGWDSGGKRHRRPKMKEEVTKGSCAERWAKTLQKRERKEKRMRHKKQPEKLQVQASR